jgi:hypothetical protein
MSDHSGGTALDMDVAGHFEYSEVDGGDSLAFLIGDESESRIAGSFAAGTRSERGGCG